MVGTFFSKKRYTNRTKNSPLGRICLNTQLNKSSPKTDKIIFCACSVLDNSPKFMKQNYYYLFIARCRKRIFMDYIHKEKQINPNVYTF